MGIAAFKETNGGSSKASRALPAGARYFTSAFYLRRRFQVKASCPLSSAAPNALVNSHKIA
jgi:hypothetical protein